MNGYQTGMSNERRGNVPYLGNRSRILWTVNNSRASFTWSSMEFICLTVFVMYVCICLSAISSVFFPFFWFWNVCIPKNKIAFGSHLKLSLCWQLNVFRHFPFSARFSVIGDIMFTVYSLLYVPSAFALSSNENKEFAELNVRIHIEMVSKCM